MSKPLFVNVSGIRNRPGSRQPIEVSVAMADLAVSGSAVADTSLVSFAGQAEAMEAAEGVVVSGTVHAQWQGSCRRCLGEAVGDIRAPVREIFEPEPVEGETYLLRGEAMNLEPLIREAVMLELPEAPLCKDDCAGLCAKCGINRNVEQCSCTEDDVDPRWAVLDVLKDV